MANFTYALGPWVRRQLGDGYYWDAPDGADGRICLGSLPDCALSPGDVDHRPAGFFCFAPDVTPSLDYLVLGTGDCRELRPSSVIRASVADLLGVAPEGDTIADWLGSFLFDLGDPTGASRWKLGTPNREGNYEVHLAGHSRIWVDQFRGPTDKRWNRLRDLLRADLSRHNTENMIEANWLKEAAKELRKAGKVISVSMLDARAVATEKHAEQVLDAMCRKYHCLPTELSTEIQRGRAQTTISDDFSGNLSAWTSDGSTWAIVSGTLQKSDSVGYNWIRHNTQLSSTDHYAQAAILTEDYWQQFVCCRFKSGPNFYRVLVGAPAGATLYKCISGSNTWIASSGTCSWVSGDTLKFSVNGTTLTVWEAGQPDQQQLQGTDSSLSDGVNVALGMYYPSTISGTPRFDNFYATDGLVAMSLLHWMQSSKRDVGSRLSGMIGQRRHTLIGR